MSLLYLTVQSSVEKHLLVLLTICLNKSFIIIIIIIIIIIYKTTVQLQYICLSILFP